MTRFRLAGAKTGVAMAMLAFLGCAGAPARRLSPAQAEAVRHNQRGVRETGMGNNADALAAFAEALRLYGSIDDREGMAVSLLNIARVSRRQGNLAASRLAIERAVGLADKGGALAAELYFEHAKLALAEGDLPAAHGMAMKSLTAPTGDNPAGQNLLALVLLRQGRLRESRGHAEDALEKVRKGGVGAEEANALRLLGGVHQALGDFARGAEYYARALEVDRRLGLSGRIAEDLRGLGEIAVKTGDLPTAIEYYRRAFEVSWSGGNRAFAIESMEKLSELYEKVGDHGGAATARQELERLREQGR